MTRRSHAVLRTALPCDEAFARVTDWQRHAVPLTSIRLTESGFVARTALGPIGFDDPMDVVVMDRPNRCRIEKRGRVVLGWAEIVVTPAGKGSEVAWTEELRIKGIPGFFDPLVARIGTVMIRSLLARTIGS